MFIRAYLRVSTSEQDPSRARGVLDAFGVEQRLRIAARYVENESGAKLHRPELFRLLADCEPGDVLLVEQVDRLSRLTSQDWLRLRGLIDARDVRIVALDLPTSWSLTAQADDFPGRMFAAVNAMMLDVLAAVARKDYEDRRRRQAEGTAKAKAAGLYKGRPANKTRNAAIYSLLANGRSWRENMNATGCNRTLLAKIARDRRLLKVELAWGIRVNGYVEFHSPECDPIVVNVDRVNFVRRFRGGNDASAVNFEKGNYVVVKGNLASVMKTLQDG